MRIWLYIAVDSMPAADRFIERIRERTAELANSPGVGRPRLELGESVRSVVLGTYVIVYRPDDRGVEIIRILHGARQIDQLFESRDVVSGLCLDGTRSVVSQYTSHNVARCSKL